jgi:PIN domain nuclease of toxin-antitoxin system
MNLLIDTHVFLWSDSLLIAQSIAENLTCVSADSVFKQYNIPIIW